MLYNIEMTADGAVYYLATRPKIWKPEKYSRTKIKEHVCPICLEEIEVGEYQRQLSCSHVFHKKCIDKWIIADVNCSCPLCRMDLSIVT